MRLARPAALVDPVVLVALVVPAALADLVVLGDPGAPTGQVALEVLAVQVLRALRAPPVAVGPVLPAAAAVGPVLPAAAAAAVVAAVAVQGHPAEAASAVPAHREPWGLAVAAFADMEGESPNAEAQGAHLACAPADNLTRLSFANISHAVDLRSCNAVCAALDTVLPDWNMIATRVSRPATTPTTSIRGHDDGSYRFRSWWGRRALTGLGIAGATCGAVADLTQAFLDERPGTFGLHCGAIRISGHLVAFTGTYRAGKTTLVTRLGNEQDVELFCDDVLPIDTDGTAMALGIQPRLRLPLPASISDAFRSFVAQSSTVRDHRYGYVSIAGQARYGTRAPLAALVVLSREADGPPRFHRMDAAEAAAYLIRQNIADPGEAEAHYNRLEAMVEKLCCLRLVYSDLEAAVALIRKAFDAPAIPSAGLEILPALPRESTEDDAEPAELGLRFARAEGVSERIIGTDTFLWQMDGRNFFSLNPVAGTVWVLLDTPAKGTEIAEVLREVFPDADPGTIASDLARLLSQMLDRGLIMAH